MEKISSFFKRRWWSFMPLLVGVGVFLFTWWLEYLPSARENDVSNIVGLLVMLSIPGTIALLFVPKQVIKVWTLIALLFFISGTIFLSVQSNEGHIMTDQGFYGLILGVGFSIFTILWAIIHTLILRHEEKKSKTV